MRYPQPPEPAALGRAWMDTQSVLPPGWWISLLSEYGEEDAYWIARLSAPQDAAVTDWPEAVAPTAEAALAGLLGQVADASLADASDPEMACPVGAASSEYFAAAWEHAVSRLPPGWWISGLDGHEGDAQTPAGWLAFAAGGPDSGYDGELGRGSTPEQALAALGEELSARRA